MKILFVTNLFPPHNIGGYEIACYATLKVLQECGYECIVLTSDFKLENIDFDDDVYSFKVFRKLKLHMAWGTSYQICNIKETSNYNSKRIEEVLKKYSINFVYFWNIYGLTTSVLRTVKLNGTKSVIHLMDESLKVYQTSFYKTFKKILKPNNYDIINTEKYINFFICMSKFLKKSYRSINECQKSVIYSYIDLPDNFNVKKNYLLKDNLINGVYLGQIESHKGVLLLAETIERINKEENFKIHFDFYGNSVSKLDKYIEQKYSEFITIKRNIPRYDILNQLKNYDFGVFPSLWDEPFGFAQIELMSAGLPVITSGAGGSKEVFSNGNHIYFNAKIDDDLYGKIIWLIKNYGVVGKEIGEKASIEVVERFSKEKYIQNLLNIFNL